ncbi:MAG: polyprenyl synthetase family protein [Alphaproteobacteria bacterium]
MRTQKNLNNVMKAMAAAVADDFLAVQNIIKSELQMADISHLPLLPEIANHLLSAGGKHIRPLLCLLSEQLLPTSTPPLKGDTTKPIVYLAAAVEFIHTATLFHDDVIDHATHRRGKNTANHIWGNHLSVLVGDFLFARAFQLMVKTNNQAVLSKLATTAATLSIGEIWQLSYQQHHQPQPLTMPNYEKIIFAKTGALFSASFAVAGLLQQYDTAHKTTRALDKLGGDLGMVFQLVDDGLDYFGDETKTQKPIGGDFYEGKMTLPILLLKTHAKHDKAIIKKLDELFYHTTQPAVKKTSDDFAWLKAQLTNYNIAAASHAHIEKFVSHALTSLTYFADSPAKQLLEEFTIASLSRQW